VPTPLPIERPVRVGIVGLGQVFELAGRAYLEHPDAEVVALCDVREERLEARGAEFPAAARYTDLGSFLESDLDLVEVLVPTPHHCEVTCAALAAGHHVNLMKPMATSLDEVDRMISARDAAGSVLRIAEDYVFYEPIQALERVVASGEIGDPVGLHMKFVSTGRGGWEIPSESWKWEFEEAKKGRPLLVFDHGWHQFAVDYWLLGPVERVMAWVGRTEITPDIVLDAPTTIMWDHASGVRSVFDITFAIDTYWPSKYWTGEERFEVTGTRGFARVPYLTAYGLGGAPLQVYRDGSLREYHDLDADYGRSFRRSTTHFLRYLRAGEGEPLFTADDGGRILATVLAALESSRANAPVMLA
jgi:UDP-N-acetylglucosamine 3-dehydrogenase